MEKVGYKTTYWERPTCKKEKLTRTFPKYW